MRVPGIVDVVIVGAGAAGLAAGRRAGELGLSFVVLEAMDRIGGRAHTDTQTFGVPWDRGCHWLHSADINPMRELADRYGFTYLTTSPPFRFHFGDRFLSEDEANQVYAWEESGWERAHEAGRAGKDVAFSSLTDASHPWFPVLRTGIAGEWSVGPDQASTMDSSRYRDTDNNWPVREGYGAIVARYAEGLPVQLSQPVTRISWGGTGVRVSTESGDIDARTVVITVSTRVIQDGLIAFDPPLPVWKQEAYDAIQLGNANKVSFAIDGRELGVDGHSSLWANASDDQGMYFQLRPFGFDLANGYLAGELGAAAEREGRAAMLDVGLSALKRVFGSAIEKMITVSECTTWQTDHYIRGAYGAARPGLAHKRQDLAIPIDEKLYWAGEATSPEFFSTCHGAHQSGIDAVDAIATILAPAGV